MNIPEIIERMANAKSMMVQAATIKSVNLEEFTCEVELASGSIRYDVRLRSVISDDTGLIEIPSQDSVVLVAEIDGLKEQMFVLSTGELDEIRVTIGDNTLVMNTDGLVFNGGDNHGLVKVSDLVSALNDLQNKVNALITAFNSHVHPSPPAPVNPVVTTPPTVPFTQVVSITTQPDLENTNVKH